MTQSDAFLAAIADRPDDDLPRFVYADWLDEHDRPERAEFIRVQCELAKLTADDPRWAVLFDRQRELLTARRDEWRLPQFQDQVQKFRRGFVERVETTAEWLLAHPGRLTGTPLVRELKVVGAARVGLRLAELPDLALVEHLDLTNNSADSGFTLPDFLAAARLDSLRALTLGNCALWAWRVEPLVEVERLRQLDRLDLWGNPFGDDGARVIADGPNLASLERLDLSAHKQQYERCVHADGALALANSAHLTRLRDLDLTDHYIGDSGLAAVVNSPNAQSLERLAVAYNEIGELGDSGVEAVVESPHLENLRELWLGGNRLSPLGAEALAAWPHLERMRVVDLRECELSEAARRRLMASPWGDRFIL